MSPRTTQAPPAAEDIGHQIQNLDDTYLQCRDLRHKWSVPKGFFKVEVEGGVRGAIYVEREVVCERCSLPRIELFRIHPRWMERISVHYDYKAVPGYRLHGDKTGLDVTGMVRLELYMRSIAEFNGLGS